MRELCDTCGEQVEPHEQEGKDEEVKKLEEDGKAVPMLELCDTVVPLEQEGKGEAEQKLEEDGKAVPMLELCDTVVPLEQEETGEEEEDAEEDVEAAEAAKETPLLKRPARAAEQRVLDSEESLSEGSDGSSSKWSDSLTQWSAAFALAGDSGKDCDNHTGKISDGGGAATEGGKQVAMKRPAGSGAATEGGSGKSLKYHGPATKRSRDSSGSASSSSGATKKLRPQFPPEEGDWEAFRKFGNDSGKAEVGEDTECKGKGDAGEVNGKGGASSAGGGNGKCEGKFHGKANDAEVEQATSLSFKSSSFEPPPHLAGQVLADILEWLLAEQTPFLRTALLFFGCQQVGQVSDAGTLESTLNAGRSLIHRMCFKDDTASSVHLKLETRKVGSHHRITLSCKLRSCFVPECQLGSQVIAPDSQGKFNQFMFLRIVFAWRCMILAVTIRKRTLKVSELLDLCLAVKKHLASEIPFLRS
jgi:hypothetical protein